MSFERLERNKAPGMDGQTLADYEVNLEANLEDLLQRLHRQSYRPNPSLRREIPKGNGKTRPLGIARTPIGVLAEAYLVSSHVEADNLVP